MIAAQRSIGDAISIRMLLPAVDVTPSGHRTAVSWRGVAGATGARLGACSLAVHSEYTGTGRKLGVVAAAHDRVDQIVLDNPEPGTLLRGLRIPALHRFEGDEKLAISSASDLGGDLHLVLTPITSGQVGAPLIAVPPLPGKNALPAQLVGGSLSGSLMQLPDIPGTRFRVTVVKGNSPEDFAQQDFSHGDVELFVAPMPVGLHVDGPDGAELFALAGSSSQSTQVDLRAALTRYFGAAVKTTGDGMPLEAAVTVRADVQGRAGVQLSTSGGVIERKLEGRLSAQATGAGARIPVPAPHSARAPLRTIADVTVTHHGMALHPISNPLPNRDAGIGGPTVRDRSVVRALPPEALRGLYVMRVAVVGWPLAETDLTLSLLGQSASVSGLTPTRERSAAAQVWFDFPSPLRVDNAVELALTATRGAFGWVSDPEPLVQIAVAAAPEGKHVRVAGRDLTLTGAETLVSGVALSGHRDFAVETDQFCSVSIANAVMEFAP
jgi:hypothetical protein